MEGIKKFQKDGGAGYRSPCPSHAKRMLYHLSYTPIQTKRRIGGDDVIEWGEREKNKKLSNGDSNPGLSRDRRRY